MSTTSDHFDGTAFFNPAGLRPQPFTAVPKMLLESRSRWPRRVVVREQRPQPLDDAAAVVTFVGHSTFLVQTPNGNLLTDPVWSKRAGPFGALGPERARQPAVRLEDLPEISLVLLSHNHYDHCDLPTLERLAKRFDPLVVTPLRNRELLRSARVRRVEELDWWQSSSEAGWSLTVTPARHFSARTPWDRNRALWGGFVFQVGDLRFYFAGDSGYTSAFREIRERLGAPDVALLPIGAYEPRWFMQAVHMNPEEAVQAHLDLGSAQSIGMHFGTFQLTAEAIDAPLVALDEALRAKNISAERFRALEFGESMRIGRRHDHDHRSPPTV